MAEENKQTNFTSFILVGLLVAVAFLAGMFWTRSNYQGGEEEVAQVSPSPALETAGVVLEDEEMGKIESGEAPTKGGDQAPVVIVEFSDFQCPACGGAAPATGQLVESYGDQVKIVFRHFPLSFHELARPASLASLCAHEQGEFWAYHDQIFENQSDLSEANLRTWAGEIGLDQAEFDTCFTEERFGDQVDADFALGQEIGVNATPTFFVNGKKVEWASQGEGWFNALKRYVESELAL